MTKQAVKMVSYRDFGLENATLPRIDRDTRAGVLEKRMLGRTACFSDTKLYGHEFIDFGMEVVHGQRVLAAKDRVTACPDTETP